MRILIFGPNGSGKGTQSAFLVKRYGLAHIESGGIFRQNIKGGTELGKKALAYIEKGQLVPDEITIPMIIDRLMAEDCAAGFVLDGFPRNPSQATALIEGLGKAGRQLNAVIVIEVARATAKARLMGRRNCANGHPNNTAIEPIRPRQDGEKLVCWKCGTEVTARKDDVDEAAIDQRLDIYFDRENGTLASVDAVARWVDGRDDVKMVRVDGEGAIEAIRDTLLGQLAD
jgi:adenylate kinase